MLKALRILFTPIVLGAILLGLTNCADHNKADKDESILKAYRLIDAGRTDEAIEHLENLLKNEPENRKAKFTLASAYAHKAGFRVQKLAPLFIESKEYRELSKQLGDENRDTAFSSLANKVENDFLKLAQLLLKISKALEIFRHIPAIEENNIVYLNHALSLMNSMEPLSASESMYRSVLNTLLFKYFVTYELMTPESFSTLSNDNKCQLDVPKFNTSLIRVGDLLINVLADYAVAKPKEAQKLAKNIEDINDSSSDLTLITTSTILIDDSASILLDDTIVQNELGKSIKCNKGDG